ncbi:MRGRH protein, partial [Turnix velox]|nr:MRGRH protein [Turnix velox]
FKMLPAVETTSTTIVSQSGGTVYTKSWHHRLLKQDDNDYEWNDCEAFHSSKVPVTLLICFCGLVGNGAVLWFLGSHVRQNPITVYVLNRAVADFAFLLSVVAALGIFYGPESLCHRLGSQSVTTALNMSILFTFTASVYLLAAFSATTSLALLSPFHWLCHPSWLLPVLLCALLWVLSFLLTFTLYFCPAALMIFILSYFLSLMTLILSGLILLSRLFCSSRQCSPRRLCLVVLLAIFFFPFLTADLVYWLLLRLFDSSAFVLKISLPLACTNSAVNPLIYFLVGSCAKKFTLSPRVAFQRILEDVTEPQNRGITPRENTVET